MLGCGVGAKGPGEETQGQGQGIRGGYDDAADTAVVGIYDDAVAATCSGSLVAPNLVLTGRHCVADVPIGCGVIGALHPAEGFFVTSQPMFIWEEKYFHRVSEIIVLPVGPASSDPLYNEDGLCGRDQALLLLEDNVAPAEAVPLVPRVDVALTPGEGFSAVGYGGTNDDGLDSGVRRRRDDLSVVCAGEGCPPDAQKTEWMGDEGTCPGDSGGPAIDEQNRVVGVLSRGVVGCTSPTYGAVFADDAWGAWLIEGALHAAEVGGYEAPPWAMGVPTDVSYSGVVGGPCDAPDCTSGLCIGVGEGPFCTRKCDEKAPCPAAWTCGDEENSGVCVPEPIASTSGGGVSTPEVNDAGEESESGCGLSGGARGGRAWEGAVMLAVAAMFLRTVRL